ncbi:MAG: MarR family transcriptional regulator [Anaerolineaceae bacterium]|nr:MarR family transcriptional regulator [Anaerolineaceae bacterium]
MDKSDSVHTLAEQLMRLFPNLGRHISSFLRDTGEEETTLMQVSVLHQIKEHSLTASDIAKKRRVSLQSASVLVQGMVEKGWIVREPNPNDRRQFLLQITPEGQEKAEATRNQIIQFLTGFMEKLSPEEIAAGQIFLPALFQILTDPTAANDTEPLDERQGIPEEENTPL